MALTDMQERFLEVLFDEDVRGDITKAAQKAGYNSPDNNAWRIARALKEQIIELTKDYLAINGPLASFSSLETSFFDALIFVFFPVFISLSQ